MADRFPSIDEIDAGQTETRGAASTADAGEGSDFLSRERALLGDDAKQFATAGDSLVDDGGADNDTDLLGGDDGHDHGDGDGPAASHGPTADSSDLAGFSSSFPAIDTTNERVAPGGTITGTSAPFRPGQALSTSAAPYGDDEEEPQVIRDWREKRDATLHQRDSVSEQRKQEKIKEAQEAIDDFYINYNKKKVKTIAQTRLEADDFLNSRENTVAGGTSWERIAKLVELGGKGGGGGGGGAGKERFRELLLSLKNDEKAPGATGH